MADKLSSTKINTKFPNMQVRNAKVSKEETDTRTFLGPGFPNGKNDVRPRLQMTFYWLPISYIQVDSIFSISISKRWYGTFSPMLLQEQTRQVAQKRQFLGFKNRIFST